MARISLLCVVLAACGERKAAPRPASAEAVEAAGRPRAFDGAPPTEQRAAPAPSGSSAAPEASGREDAAKAGPAGAVETPFEALVRLNRAVVDMAAKVDEVHAAVDVAQNDADLAAAQARLRVLARTLLELRVRRNQALEAAIRAAQRHPPPRPPHQHVIPKECLENALAKSCR